MAAEVATVWQPQFNQEGEYTASDSSNIDTESGLDLLTENSNNLILEDSIFTQVPATVYNADPGL